MRKRSVSKRNIRLDVGSKDVRRKVKHGGVIRVYINLYIDDSV